MLGLDRQLIFESIKMWPSLTWLEGWKAVDKAAEPLAVAREAGSSRQSSAIGDQALGAPQARSVKVVAGADPQLAVSLRVRRESRYVSDPYRRAVVSSAIAGGRAVDGYSHQDWHNTTLSALGTFAVLPVAPVAGAELHVARIVPASGGAKKARVLASIAARGSGSMPCPTTYMNPF